MYRGKKFSSIKGTLHIFRDSDSPKYISLDSRLSALRDRARGSPHSMSRCVFQLIRSSGPTMSHDTLSDLPYIHRVPIPTDKSIAYRSEMSHVHNSTVAFRSRNVDGIVRPSSPLLTARTGRKRYFSLLRCFIGKGRLPPGRRRRDSEKWCEGRIEESEKRNREAAERPEATSER